MDVELLAPQLLAWPNQRREDLLDELRAWVEMESPSLDKARVDAFGGVVAAAFARQGARVQTQAVPEWGDVVEAVFEPAASRKLAQSRRRSCCSAIWIPSIRQARSSTCPFASPMDACGGRA